MYMKSGGGLGPAAPLCHGRCETDGVGGTDGEDSSELRQGQQSKPHSPCRAGPFPSKNNQAVAFFRAPGVVEALECAGDRIAVGCQNGEVLHLQAPWLVDS